MVIISAVQQQVWLDYTVYIFNREVGTYGPFSMEKGNLLDRIFHENKDLIRSEGP